MSSPTLAILDADDPATTHLAALAIEIDGIFSRFQMSEQEAAHLLGEVLLLTIYRWDRVESHDLWLLTTLRRGCLRRLRQRARQLSH
ncbi:MAG TPA: hypothetical protein VG477_19605 [Thermoanaerobaculia bacterium]|nr:hypothetical protein [Thermoanaerobaculia bacterium]